MRLWQLSSIKGRVDDTEEKTNDCRTAGIGKTRGNCIYHTDDVSASNRIDHSHCTGGETEAQGVKPTCPRSHTS